MINSDLEEYGIQACIKCNSVLVQQSSTFTLNVPVSVSLLRHQYDAERLFHRDRPVRALTHPSFSTRYA